MDPMTVVIHVDPKGGIVNVFTELPLKIIQVAGDGNGGVIETNPHAGMLARITNAAEAILNPYRHLDHIQHDRIIDIAVRQLVDENANQDERFRKATNDVLNMSIQHRLDVCGRAADDEDDVELDDLLGFNPVTGEDHPRVGGKINVATIEPIPPAVHLHWGRTRLTKVWHFFSVLPKRTYPKSKDKTKELINEGKAACGEDVVVLSPLTPIKIGDTPEPSPGSSTVCANCIDRLNNLYPKGKS